MNGFNALIPIRWAKEAGTNASLPPIVSVPESALGSHPCVALSSAQANIILPQIAPAVSGGFLREATNHISGRFLVEATGSGFVTLTYPQFCFHGSFECSLTTTGQEVAINLICTCGLVRPFTGLRECWPLAEHKRARQFLSLFDDLWSKPKLGITQSSQ